MAEVSPLAALIAGETDDNMVNAVNVRRLYAHVTTKTNIKGVEDTAVKHIKFKISSVAVAGNIARAGANVMRAPCAITIPEELREDFNQVARRHQALPQFYRTMDLSGVVCRLAKAITMYANWGQLTAIQLRGGGNVQIRSVANAVEPIAPNPGAVFVTSRIATNARSNVIAALANAISGEGGTMFTDLLGINANGVVQVPIAADGALAQGCYQALQLIGSLYVQCGEGATFSYWVVKGIHMMQSVHGHTEEGAYTRTVIRRFEAAVPYGAVLTERNEYTGLPDPGRSVSGFRSLVDSIAVASAGAVALCDPMQEYKGKTIPTVLTSDQGGFTDPGDNNAGNDDDSRDLTEQYANVAGKFAELYIKALGELLSASGGGKAAMRFFTMQANDLAGTVERHCRAKTIIAFMWIEPTGSCPIGDDSYPAYVARHGPLATTNVPREIPALDGVNIIESESDSTETTVLIDMRTMRTHGLFSHLTMHPRNGMGSITLMSGVVDNFALIGGAGAMGPRILAGGALSTYQWMRGDSDLISPGEFLDINASTKLRFNHIQMGGRGAGRRLTHVPKRDELIKGNVRVEVSRLRFADIGAHPQVPREIRRSRSRAAVAVSMAADAHSIDVALAGYVNRPQLVDYGPITRVVEPQLEREDMVQRGQAAPGNEDGIDGGGAAPPGGIVNGAMAPLHILNVADRGRRAPRPAVAVGGGGPAGGGGGPQGAAPVPAGVGGGAANAGGPGAVVIGGPPPQPPGGGGHGGPVGPRAQMDMQQGHVPGGANVPPPPAPEPGA